MATAYYGRIGTGPKLAHRHKQDTRQCPRAVTSKIGEKLAKGYVQVSDTGWAFQGQLDVRPSRARRQFLAAPHASSASFT